MYKYIPYYMFISSQLIQFIIFFQDYKGLLKKNRFSGKEF